MANVKIMLSAGETSGDLHGARIAGELKRQEPGMELVGFGGDRMAEQGVRLWHNFKNYNVMGVWEVLVNLRRIWELLHDLVNKRFNRHMYYFENNNIVLPVLKYAQKLVKFYFDKICDNNNH